MTKEEAIRIISGEVLGTTEQTNEAVAMAVEALSAQPVNCRSTNLIDKKEVLDAIHKVIFSIIDTKSPLTVIDKQLISINKAITTKIKELQPAQPDVPDTNVGKWIPVTERLPGKSGNYLVTWEAVKGCTTTVQMMHFYQYLGGFEDAVKHILAWMPLPEPYKGDAEE